MTLLLVSTLLLPSLALRPPNSGSPKRGFGSQPPPPPPPRRPQQAAASSLDVKLKRPQPAAASGLDAKLKEQHRSNCEASAARWGTLSGDDALPGTYTGGWHEYEAASVAPQNAPYGTDRLLLRSRAPLLSEELCASLIVLMEAHGAANGFDARYPVTGFTREVNVADIPDGVVLLSEALRTTLLPAAAAEFPSACRPSSLRVNEALVIKYDAATGNNCLPVHQDFSLLTINVALSPRSAFRGGGTWFEHSRETVLTERGEAVMHAGGLRHCGVPVAQGVRYQLVLFLLSTDHPDVAGRLQAIGAAAGAKAAQGGRAPLDIALSTAALERACALNPLDGESWSLLGCNRRQQSDLDGAARAFERAASLSADTDFGALVNLAAVRSAQQRPADALAALQKALAIGAPPSPSQPADELMALHNAGMQLFTLGSVEEAGLVFEAVVEADPDALDSWAALGLCMAKLGQEEAALACQRQVLRIRAKGTGATGAAGGAKAEDRGDEDG